MKRYLILICLAFLSIACAGSKKASDDEGRSTIVFLTVKNTLNSSVGIYWQGQGTFPMLLGRIKAGKKEKFVIENVFYNDRIRLIARPNFGGSLIAQVPIDIENGKNIVWELSRNFVAWKIN
jgi:hypothetical protein